MSLFQKLFKRNQAPETDPKTKAASSPLQAPQTSEGDTPEAKLAAMLLQEASFQQKAQAKERNTPIAERELMQVFSEYFAPNTDFFSVPGSAKFTAYFKVINAAVEETVKNPTLFTAATKWTPQQLADLINNPKPAITNMLLCGLIFTLGNYAVINHGIYCVDFCQQIPNCIAMFLLLVMQKQPSEHRKMLIDAGTGSNTTALADALHTLSVCDPSWHFVIG